MDEYELLEALRDEEDTHADPRIIRELMAQLAAIRATNTARYAAEAAERAEAGRLYWKAIHDEDAARETPEVVAERARSVRNYLRTGKYEDEIVPTASDLLADTMWHNRDGDPNY